MCCTELFKNLESMSGENLEFDTVSVSKAMLFGALENRERKFTSDSFNLHNQHLHSRSHLENQAVFQASCSCTDDWFCKCLLHIGVKQFYFTVGILISFFPPSKPVLTVTMEKKLIFSSEFTSVTAQMLQHHISLIEHGFGVPILF